MSDDLGPRIRHHAWRARFDSAVMPVVMMVVFAAMTVMFFALGNVAIVFGVMALAMTGMMGGFALTSLRDRNDVIDVHERGVVARRRGVTHAWPWQDVRFRFNATRDRTSAPGRVYHYHSLGRGDATIPVDSDFADIEALVESIESGILQHQLVPVATEIASGQPRSFGPMTVSRDGIDSPIVAIAWSQIASVDVTLGRVAIRRLGDGLQIAFDYAALWNGALALALLRAGMAGAFAGDGPLRTSDLRRHVDDVLRDPLARIPRRK